MGHRQESTIAIDEHAVIGDGRSAALVTRDGTVNWLCWPRFDSSPVFSALLDPDRGGAWRLGVPSAHTIHRRYLPDSNVLETRFGCADGTAVLVDAMAVVDPQQRPRRLDPEHQLVRVVRCEAGEVELELLFQPRPDFGRSAVRLHDAGPLGIRFRHGRALWTFASERPVNVRDDQVSARLRLRAGEVVRFSLCYDEDGPAVLPPLGTFADQTVQATVEVWRSWTRRLTYEGPFRDHVVRSALAVKLLAFAPSGAIVAAATTSLPERLGGDLNWDYRFCWLRDAAFTARALFALGCSDEAQAFCDWLLHATRLDQPRLRVLYDVHGNRPPRERSMEHLTGYAGSRPVRVGNAADGQSQWDVYGEVVDAAAQLAMHTGRLDRDTQRLLVALGKQVCRVWREPDAGLWEERGEGRAHTHSRLLCWVALDRLMDLHGRGLIPKMDPGPFARERDEIRRCIETRHFAPGLVSYVATEGGRDMDAALWLMDWYRFEPPGSARMQGTSRRLTDRLQAGPGLFYRYDRSRKDGEGAFGICSFWAAEHLARQGRVNEAHRLFASVLRYENDLGLFAEEIDPLTGRALGNFPQAYTHVGLINAALTLARAEARAQRTPPRAAPRRGAAHLRLVSP